MMKPAVALITALSLSFLISAGADATPKGKKIAFLVTSPTHPFIATLSKTFVSRANSFGMEVNTVSQHLSTTPSPASSTCWPSSPAPSRLSCRR